jgi:hypothetical protein
MMYGLLVTLIDFPEQSTAYLDLQKIEPFAGFCLVQAKRVDLATNV